MRISALEGIEAGRDAKGVEGGPKEKPGREAERCGSAPRERDAPAPAREKPAEMDFGL